MYYLIEEISFGKQVMVNHSSLRDVKIEYVVRDIFPRFISLLYSQKILKYSLPNAGHFEMYYDAEASEMFSFRCYAL